MGFLSDFMGISLDKNTILCPSYLQNSERKE